MSQLFSSRFPGMRSKLTTTFSALLLIACLSCNISDAREEGKLTTAKKPNIIVFLVDDMGLMDTSVPFLADQKGQPHRHPLNEFYRTPNMERLAQQGTRFSQFYAMSVCSPTRASIMTGQTSARHYTTQFIRTGVTKCRADGSGRLEMGRIQERRHDTSYSAEASRLPDDFMPAKVILVPMVPLPPSRLTLVLMSISLDALTVGQVVT